MMRPRRRSGGELSWATALAVALSSQRSFAFPTSRLTYARGSGAEACPDEPAVRQAVAMRLGYDPFFPSAEKTIVARIVRSKEEVRATVELVDERGMMRGVRELKAPAGQCGELVATMALAISIAIDPTNPSILGTAPVSIGVDSHAGKPGLQVPAPADRGAVVESSDLGRSEVAPNGEAIRGTPGFQIRPGAMAVGAFGTAPGATMGLAITANVRRGSWSLVLEGRGDLPASIDVSGGGRVRTSLWVGAFGPCLHFDPLYVCATAWIGDMHAEGVDLAVPRTARALYAAAGPRIGTELAVGDRFAFRPELALQTTLRPVALQVDSTTQWVAPRFALLAAAGFIVHFP